MSRILVVHDIDPDLFIELDYDEHVGYDGICSDPDCGYHVSDGWTRHSTIADAVDHAAGHLDHDH